VLITTVLHTPHTHRVPYKMCSVLITTVLHTPHKGCPTDNWSILN